MKIFFGGRGYYKNLNALRSLVYELTNGLYCNNDILNYRSLEETYPETTNNKNNARLFSTWEYSVVFVIHVKYSKRDNSKPYPDVICWVIAPVLYVCVRLFPV